MERQRDPALNLLGCLTAILCGAIVFLSFAIAASGQEAVVAPDVERWPPNMVIVVDTSQSMAGAPLDAALTAFEQLSSHGSDEWRLGVVAFGSTGHRWSGDGDGWADMPSTDAVDRAREWLRLVDCGGSTLAWTGLEIATREIPDDGLTVIVVSDGCWQDAGIVQSVLPARLNDRLVIATYAVGREEVKPTDTWPRPIMRTVGRLGRGGCWQ